MTDTTVLDDALITLIKCYELRSLDVEPLGVENKVPLKLNVGDCTVTVTIHPVAGEEDLLRVQVALIDGRAIRQLPRKRSSSPATG